MKLIIGSRDSQLAVTQTQWAIEELKKAHPNLEIEHKLIRTEGDKDQTTELDKFANLGVFVKELQIALLKGEIDCAVHSLKDVPELQPEGLALVCFPEREDPKDVFISQGTPFIQLPQGAQVGTGSPRRIMQLRKMRPDIKFVPIRGNLDTRIKKVTDGELDGIILAAAGLNRLNQKENITHSFSFDAMIPAIGQGCLALESRDEDTETISLLRSINHDLTEVAIRMEREFMTRVGGGCKVPMACHVYPYGDGFRMMAIMGDAKVDNMARIERSGGLDEIESLVEDITQDILEDCKDKSIPIPKDLPDNYLTSNS